MKLGIIFDCDGTLIDSEYIHYLSWHKALSEHGLNFSENEYREFAGLEGRIIAKGLVQKYNRKSLENLHLKKMDFYHALQSQGIPPIDRSIKFVRNLYNLKEQLEIKMGVASAAPKDEILINLKHHGIIDCFDVVVSGYDDLSQYNDPEGVNKPKPYIYLHAAKLLGLKPHQCVALEDSGPGVLSASSAGLITFATPNTFTRHHDFSRAHFQIASDSEIEIGDFFKKIESIILK